MKNTINCRNCRKCGSKIPYWAKINGKRKSLKNRKFCLDCSGYGDHNTSPHDPVERRKTSPAYREMVTLSLYKRGLERKTKLVAMLGGKCQICGYDKTRRALTFHHRDRAKKLFGLSLNILWSRCWSDILTEVKKCDLLCMNCHAETEDQISGENIVDRVNAKYGTQF